MGGILGARLAGFALESFGLVVVILPFLFSLWGLLIVLGFEVQPQQNMSLVYLSHGCWIGIVHVQLSSWDLADLALGLVEN